MQVRTALFAAFAIACGPQVSQTSPTNGPVNTNQAAALAPVWRSPSLGVRDGDAAAALRAPFEYPVSVANSAKVSASAASCEDYFRLKAEGYGAKSEEDHNSWRSEGVRCEAIKRSLIMRPGGGETARAFLTDTQLLQGLPASVGPSVSSDELALRKESEAKGQTWSDYAPAATLELQTDVAIVKEPDTISRLRPLAAGDLDGDGEAELLVEAVCNGTEGTWVDIRLLMLSPVAAGGGTRSYRLRETVNP
jgi:hypothetical protein